MIINSILGVIAMFILNAIGISVPINLSSIIIVALGGLLGLAIVVVLHFLGVIF